MNINLGPAAHTLENKIAALMNLTSPESQNAVCPDKNPNVPARSVNISAMTNGWMVTVDVNYAMNTAGTPYVYTNADDVAASVWGLIVEGKPEKTLPRPDVMIEAARAEGFAQGQKQPPGACDHAAAVRAFNDGFSQGKADGLNLGRTECGYVYPPAPKQRDDRILELENRLEETTQRANNRGVRIVSLNFQLEEAKTKAVKDYNEGYLLGRKDGERSILGRYPWREINEKSKQIDELESQLKERGDELERLRNSFNVADGLAKQRAERIKVLESEVSALNKQLAPCCRNFSAPAFSPHRLPGEPLCGFQVGDVWTSDDGTVRTISGVSEHRVDYGKQTYHNPLPCHLDRHPDRKNTWLKRVGTDARMMRGDKLFVECFTPDPSPEKVNPYQVGDVWRDRNGEVRCISEITPARISYQHTFQSGNTSPDGVESARDFASCLGGDATVKRNAFMPARFPGEPEEGFMVGDVWTTSRGHTRTVVEVSADVIRYDYRTDETDTDQMIINNNRVLGRNTLDNEGATLTRK